MNKRTILNYLRNPNDPELFKEADRVRKKFCADKVFIRGLIEFSNHCCRNCLYCGLRGGNRALERYRLSPEEIIALSRRIIGQGIRTVVLQSGDDFFYTRTMLCAVIRRIKSLHPEVAVTLSVGERRTDDYRAFRDAGADRYLLKHETSNPRIYAAVHPGHRLSRRVRILETLRKLGYQVGVGIIVGLPGQTLPDLADDIVFMRDWKPEMAGIGPFIPQRHTPLRGYPAGDCATTLRVLALTRITSKTVLLPVTTALASRAPQDGLRRALSAGANVIMVNFSPRGKRPQYLIYDHKIPVSFKAADAAIRQAGRIVGLERGDGVSAGKKRGKSCF